jgi:hypothetical protein
MPTRVTFDFQNQWSESLEKLEQILCSSHWTGRLNITDDRVNFLLDLVGSGAIAVYECLYERQTASSEIEAHAQDFASMMRKQYVTPAVTDMAVLFVNETAETVRDFRNVIHLPERRVFTKSNGMEPSQLMELLEREDCDAVLLFPDFPLCETRALYAYSLGVSRGEYNHLLEEFRDWQMQEMAAATERANEYAKGIFPDVSAWAEL